MNISLAFSSCPNDTFIFDALVHKKIDTKGYNFTVHIADVEELNTKAFSATFDVTKLSFNACAHVTHEYKILHSGSALGYNNGPLFITTNQKEQSIHTNSKIVLPGKHTTAHLLFSIAYPLYTKKDFCVFSEIEHAIKTNKADAGVIIHENRFTYAERGFSKILDLGEFWEQATGCPIPLGTIAIKNSFNKKVQKDISDLIRKSIEFAFENPTESIAYIQSYAQDLTLDVIKKHISLFVNNFSIDLGENGINAITTLFKKGIEYNIFPEFNTKKVFI